MPLSVDEAPRTSFVRLQVGVGGAGFDAPLRGASAYGEGSELCARLWGLRGGECAPVGVEGESSGRRCPPDWTSVNLAGSLGASTVVDRFLELQGDAVPPICGLELLLQARDVTPAALPITSVRVDTLADPIERFVAEYAEILADLRADASEPSPIALGTDFNGLARRFPFTALRDEARAPGSLLRAGGCDWEAPSVPSPWSFHRRGWATYGGLADLLSALQRVPGQGRRVVDELFSSAEAVLRFWERAIERGRCMPGSAGCPRCAEVVDDCRRLAGAGDCAGAQEPPICDPEIEE